MDCVIFYDEVPRDVVNVSSDLTDTTSTCMNYKRGPYHTRLHTMMRDMHYDRSLISRNVPDTI